MARRGEGAVRRELGWLFGQGTATGLGDSRLVDRFLDRRDPGAAEAAFVLLVERHGAMVRRVCGRVLADPADLPDAVQATFLVLARKAGSVRDRGSLAGWLHGVAVRVSRAANASAATRRRHEQRRAGLAPGWYDPDPDDGRELLSALHREVERLPERLRSAIVLCDLRGLTDEQAATELGCPLGTVKSRLSTARRTLRDRLTRLGLAPTSALPFGRPVGSALPQGLADATARGALRFSVGNAAATVAAEAWSWSLAEGVVRLMTLKLWASWVLAGLTAAAVAGSGAAWAFRAPAQEQGGTPGKGTPPRASATGLSGAERTRAVSALEQAMAAAERIDVPWLQGRAFADLAAARARLGDRAGAEATFRRAAEVFKTLEEKPAAGITTPEEARAESLLYLASARFAAGDADEAQRLVREGMAAVNALPDRGSNGSPPKFRSLFSFSQRMAELGAAPVAIEAASAVTGDGPRSLALARVGQLLANQGAVKDALAAIEEAEPGADRVRLGGDDPVQVEAMSLAMAEGYADVAGASAAAGDPPAARALLEKANRWAERLQPCWKPQAVARTGTALIRLGDEPAGRSAFADAVRLIDGHTVPEGATPEDNQKKGRFGWVDPAAQLARLGLAQLDAGDREGGLATLRKAAAIVEADESADRQNGPHVLAIAWAQAGMWDEGLALLDRKLGGVMTHLAESIGRGQAEAGGDREALAWAANWDNAAERSYALLGVVRGLLDRAGRR